MTNKVCVAAVDLQTLNLVRPLLHFGNNWPQELPSLGLRPGRILRQKVFPKKLTGQFPHHTEDIQLIAQFEMLELLSSSDLFKCLVPGADPSIDKLFDGNVRMLKYVTDGSHCRSLGSVLVDPSMLDLHLVGSTKMRLTFTDPTNVCYDLPVTEFLGTTNTTLALQRMTQLICKAQKHSSQLLLRIGLARGFDGHDAKWDPKRCYLQVNGLLFA